MCGYVFSLTKRDINIKKGLDLIKHRGPNFQGTHKEIVNDYVLDFGHSRLSIIDVQSHSNQPFKSDCGRYFLIFNGEIYNYLQLKKQFLENEVFKTTSDTEVLLKLLIKHNKKILNDLDGMFSFVFYDKEDKSLLVVRDQLGIKPLYYTQINDELFIASEIKPLFSLSGLVPKVCEDSLYDFMRNSFVYEPCTGFKNISKMPSGHYFEINLEKNSKIIKIEKYWAPQSELLNKAFSTGEIHSKINFEEKIISSIERQQISDVPLGVFFSGGVDSTIILSHTHNDTKAFTVKNDQKALKDSAVVDDYYYAKKISSLFKKELSTIKFKATTDKNNFLKELEKTVLVGEELIADFTLSVSQQLSKQAREQGMTVMLSGLGADEIFGGYDKYRLLQYPFIFKFINYVSTPFLKLIPSFNKKLERFNTFCSAKGFADQYTGILGYFSKEDIESLIINYKPEHERNYSLKLNNMVCEADTPFRKAMLADLHGFLQHNFTVADKSSMQESIELRVPLATKELFEEAYKSNRKELFNFFKTKIKLRKLLKGVVPKQIMERKKSGFHPPIDTVINEIGMNELMAIYERNSLFELLDKEAVYSILNTHFSSKTNNTYKIFQLLFLSYWFKSFIKKEL